MSARVRPRLQMPVPAVVVAVFVLLAAGCTSTPVPGSASSTTVEEPLEPTSSSTTTTTTTTPKETGPSTTPTTERAEDDQLVIGTLFPSGGDLASLGPPMRAGAELARRDVAAAGGILGGQDVVIVDGDTGDPATDQAEKTAERLLAEGVDVVVGAASSDVSLRVIDDITGAGVVLFSPANTAPVFTTYDDDGLYFRTAPSDVLQGRVLAGLLVDAEATRIAIAARSDEYGEGLLAFTQAPLEDAGVEVSGLVYDTDDPDFESLVENLSIIDPDAIVLIGFDETAELLAQLIEAGLGPQDRLVFGVDGNIGGALGEAFADEPGALSGFRGTLPSAELTEEFAARIAEVDDELADLRYAPETYDTVIIAALAAEAAGTDDSRRLAAMINGVTLGGTKCTSFSECKALLADGVDIDYDGEGGPYAFTDVGEPSAASFAVLTYGEDNLIDPAATVFRFAKLDEDEIDGEPTQEDDQGT